ncbi:hypothetical protein B4168_2515 [Anoxybacillus flavithermus]|nr:hypothetical protein B4168_2515 [Anoxybacillus flavithermus]OAO85265.1 hypothetical protein GT23_2956 [Parageobacillus thermoglucosidasius]
MKAAIPFPFPNCYWPAGRCVCLAVLWIGAAYKTPGHPLFRLFNAGKHTHRTAG